MVRKWNRDLKSENEIHVGLISPKIICDQFHEKWSWPTKRNVPLMLILWFITNLMPWMFINHEGLSNSIKIIFHFRFSFQSRYWQYTLVNRNFWCKVILVGEISISLLWLAWRDTIEDFWPYCTWLDFPKEVLVWWTTHFLEFILRH